MSFTQPNRKPSPDAENEPASKRPNIVESGSPAKSSSPHPSGKREHSLDAENEPATHIVESGSPAKSSFPHSSGMKREQSLDAENQPAGKRPHVIDSRSPSRSPPPHFSSKRKHSLDAENVPATHIVESGSPARSPSPHSSRKRKHSLDAETEPASKRPHVVESGSPAKALSPLLPRKKKKRKHKKSANKKPHIVESGSPARSSPHSSKNPSTHTSQTPQIIGGPATAEQPAGQAFTPLMLGVVKAPTPPREDLSPEVSSKRRLSHELSPPSQTLQGNEGGSRFKRPPRQGTVAYRIKQLDEEAEAAQAGSEVPLNQVFDVHNPLAFAPLLPVKPSEWRRTRPEWGYTDREWREKRGIPNFIGRCVLHPSVTEYRSRLCFEDLVHEVNVGMKKEQDEADILAPHLHCLDTTEPFKVVDVTGERLVVYLPQVLSRAWSNRRSTNPGYSWESLKLIVPAALDNLSRDYLPEDSRGTYHFTVGQDMSEIKLKASACFVQNIAPLIQSIGMIFEGVDQTAYKSYLRIFDHHCQRTALRLFQTSRRACFMGLSVLRNSGGQPPKDGTDFRDGWAAMCCFGDSSTDGNLCLPTLDVEGLGGIQVAYKPGDVILLRAPVLENFLSPSKGERA